jgi:nucleotide-binding universal stress UspA family protein
MLKKMLVPLDGSAQAEGVLPYVEALARVPGSAVTLYHAIDPETLERNDPAHARYLDHIIAKVEMRSRDYLRQVERRVRVHVPCVDTKVITGYAARAIVEDAESGGYDLIAMSTHGRSGLGRWVLGSTADKVLHGTELPVLLVRPSEAGEQAAVSSLPLQRVLVPLDGSELAESALPYAAEVARRVDAEVELVRVVQYQMGAGFGLYVEDPLGELEQAVREYLLEVEKQVRQEGVRVTANVLWGFAGTRIVDAAHATPGTIVVMTSHGRSGPGRWVLGSIADKVVRSTDVPVLIVRSAS